MPTDVRRDYLHARARKAYARRASLPTVIKIAKKLRGRERLVRAGVLAPDTERFLRRAVGDREQHGFLPRPVGVMLPRRHHEHVVGAPFQHLAVDRGGALP